MKKKILNQAIALLFTISSCNLLLLGCGLKSESKASDNSVNSPEIFETVPSDLSLEVEEIDNHTEQTTVEEITIEEITEEDTAEEEIEENTDEADSELFSTEGKDPEMTLDPIEYIQLDPNWKYADYAAISTGTATLYRASDNRRDIVIGINAGHGTQGGQKEKTYCHPDKTAKVTGGTTSAGSIKAPAVSSGMSFTDGTPEAKVTLMAARLVKDRLLDNGYDVLMLRDDDDVQLDNIARTVIANNTADCLISLHWDGDGLDYDKGCFYISTPDGIKHMEPVSEHWEEHHQLGDALIEGLKEQGCKIYQNGSMAVDLTQTSYSCIPSIDIELGNQSSDHGDAALSKLADGIVAGIKRMY